MAFDVESIAHIVKEGVPALEILAGSKAAVLFLEKVSGAIGWYVDPKQTVRKARAEAAASLIKAEADQGIKTIEQRATSRIIHEETKFQENIESIVLSTLANIKEDAEPENVNDDWLTSFFSKSKMVSDAEMQKLWSQILAGEVNEPGKFSLKTLNALSLLTKQDAEVFVKLRSFTWLHTGFYPMLIIPNGILSKAEFLNQLNGSELYHIEDAGFIFIQTNKEVSFSGGNVFFDYFGKRYSITHTGNADGVVKDFPTGFVKFSQIGTDLAHICTGEPDWTYADQMIKMWASKGFTVSET